MYDYIKDLETISLVGICKNAGKTTVLTKLLKELGEKNVKIALTSIGRDGETVDTVTKTKKPKIYVKSETIIATSQNLLKNCDITKEILKKTQIPTALGDVVILRALSDGFVEIAGPSIVKQLEELKEDFKNFGAEKIIIDGAISRKSLASAFLCDAVILCSGASFSKDMSKVINETKHIKNILTLEKFSDKEALKLISQSENNLVITKDYTTFALEKELGNVFLSKKTNEIKYIYINGAMTDNMLSPFFSNSKAFDELGFVVNDSSKILIKAENYEKLLRLGFKIFVLKSVKLAAVCINPFSSGGFNFDKDLFKQKMEEVLEMRVINVMEAEND